MRIVSCDVRQGRTGSNRGFTLVELLVVISIIGILVALIMPAVNSARESGRRAQCSNNLHQMASACLALESKNGHLPGGGWGYKWAGDPDRGAGANQPGGWQYNILPFIDQVDLHDLGKGTDKVTKPTLGIQRNEKPVAVYLCPTRRKVQAYPRLHKQFLNVSDAGSAVIGRSDYAANAGSNFYDVEPGGPNNGDTGLPISSPAYDWSKVGGTINSVLHPSTGVIFRASEVSMASIKDGASNTYLIGERFVSPDAYVSGNKNGNNPCPHSDQGWDMGYDYDTVRWTGADYVNLAVPQMPPASNLGTAYRPLQDQPPSNCATTNFGSSHPAGFHMAFCDGSVMKLNYDIAPAVHMQLGHRSDGQPADLTPLAPK